MLSHFSPTALLLALLASSCAGAPPGGREPQRGADGRYLDCEVLHDGYCYDNRDDACRAAGCRPGRCEILRTDPGKVACAAPPRGAHEPVKGPDGMYRDCQILHDGYCYMSEADACQAAGCPGEDCLILDSEPGQVECQK
jgi:hypothetical protein